jgi:predicted amidophosphoribosyltransferase
MTWLDLLCPTRCSGCGAAGPMLCRSCGLLLAGAPRRHAPTPCPPGMPATCVVATYDGAVRAMLLDFKERGAVGLAGPLGDSLSRAVRAVAPGGVAPLLLAPAPSAPAAVRRRGDHVVRLLAEHAARRLRRDGRSARVADVLRQSRRVADSAGLSAHDRARNLAGGLMVRRSAESRVYGAAVVVVDDLVTTGATLSEAAAALGRAGAQVVGAAAIASTQLRGVPGR